MGLLQNQSTISLGKDSEDLDIHKHFFDMTEQKFELTAVVELFGHTRMAGTVTEQVVGDASFIRIDVPETKVQPKFTRLLNPKAIYAINPVTKKVMLEMAQQMEVTPIESWDIRTMHEKLLALNECEEVPT